jgi:hypothetical protein
MAVNEPQVFHPRLPEENEQRPVRFHFDRLSDTLVVFFGNATPRPTVNIPTSDYEYLRVDAETEELVGFMVEDLTGYAVYQNWMYLQYAALAGLEHEEIAALRERVEAALRDDPDDQRRALVNTWLHNQHVAQQFR